VILTCLRRWSSLSGFHYLELIILNCITGGPSPHDTATRLSQVFESGPAGIDSISAELLFDTQQLVVFGYTIRAGQ
jgi:hypothetical protein